MMLQSIFIALVLCSSVFGISFQVNSGTQRCIQADYSQDVAYTANIKVTPIDDNSNLQFTLRTENGQIIQQLPEIRDTAEFKFVSIDNVNYHWCFMDTPKYQQYGNQMARVITVSLEETLVIDESNILKKKDLKSTELKISRLEGLSEKFRRNSDHLRKREMAHRDTTESTNARVKWLMIGSIAIVGGLAFVQVYYLRTFIKSKKRFI